MTKKVSNQQQTTVSARVTRAALMLALGTLGVSAQAQVTTNGGSGLAATYPTLNDAILALNAAGPITSPVVITLTGNETAPAGGYSITAEGTAANTIIIEGSGSTITANGTHTVGALNDAIFKLVGADFVTLRNFTMQENAANTVTAAATNTMTEWGVALLYASTTNGAQNNTIQSNTISLNRTYQNTFGIYSNSTHAAATPTTAATATGTTGGNSGLKIYTNAISNVNMGVVVVGPTGAADANNGLEIGGSAVLANTISDYGTTGTFSGYANVSGTVNGILVRNTVNFVISHNSITSSNGGTTAGTLRGIYIPAASNAPTATYTNTISNNTISVRSGVTAGTIHGIFAESTSGAATGTLTISNNNFTDLQHTTGTASGAIIGINTTSAVQTLTVTGNTFTGLTANTTGSFTFISHSYTMPANGSQTVSNNSVVGGFSKTGAGGTVTFSTTGASSPNTATGTYTNNSFTNITVTGATGVTGFLNNDGAGSSATKTYSGNMITDITGGTSAISGITVNYWGGVAAFTNNTFNNVTGQGAITAFTLGNTFAGATSINVSGNTATNLTSTGAGGNVVGLTCSNTSPGIDIANNTISGLSTTGASAVSGVVVSGANASGTTVRRNKICSLSGSNASSTVNGILVSGGTLVSVINNVIGDLTATAANAANPVNGINVTGGTTVNVYYNTVRMDGTSSGALFGSSAVSASTTPTVALINNLLINNGTPTGTGLCVAYRRSTATLTTYAAASNNNSFVASTIFTDGTNTDATLGAYQTRVAPRDAVSISAQPTFLSTSCSNANFLRADASVYSQIESGGTAISGIDTDIDGDARQGSAGYSGTGTAPDIGADEVNMTPPACVSADGGTIANATVALCTSSPSTTLSSTGSSIGAGITLQWKVSSTPGGPYSNVTGGTGATTISYNTGTLAAGTYYYVLEATCSFGPITDLSNEVTVTVTANPTVSVTPTTAAFCTPSGTPVALTASGAATYAWSPAAGLSATTGTSVNASPTAGTTYTVVGTDANGCTATATATVSVSYPVTINSTTATPSSVCLGANSQLAVNVAAPPVSTYAYTSGTGTTLADMTGATQVIGNSNDDTPTATPATIGFDFSFNGVTYTQYSVSPDGWILLGGATAASQFTNAVASTTNIPKIYPMWDDLATGTDGNVQVLLTGTAPNRILIFQWFVTIPRNTTGPANSTFQTWLYEGSNAIEFRYGAMGNPPSASVGLTAGATNFNCVTVSTNTASTTTANNANAVSPANGTIYTFMPPTVAYAWSPATFLNSTTIANPLASNITSTTAYTVTATSGACSATGTVTVTAGSPLSATVGATPSLTACEASSVTLNALPVGGGAPYAFSWAGPNGFTSTDQNPVLASVTSVNAGSYSVTITDNCGVSTTASSTLVVTALPTIAVTPTSATYCAPGTGVTLTASGAATYTWSPAAGLSAATGASVVATPSATTTYSVTGTDANGCTATEFASVAVAPAVTGVTVTSSPLVICDGNATLTATASFAPFTYCEPVYTNGTGFGDYVSSVQLNTLNSTSVGAAAPYYTLFPATGTTTTTLTAGTSYTITLSAGTYTQNDLAAWIDFNQNGILDDAGEKLGETNNVGATPATTSFTFTVPAGSYNGTTRLRVRDADYGGTGTMDPCSAVSTYGETEDYIITIVGGVDPYTVSWSPNTFLASTTGSTVNATGVNTNITYTATVNSLAGCSNTGTVALTATTPLSATLATTTPVSCPGVNDAVVTATPAGGVAGYTYAWSNAQTTAAATGLTAGVYTVTVGDANGCSISSSITVTDPTAVVANATATDILCNGGTNGTATAAPTGGTGAYTYAWSNAATTATITGLSANSYTVTVTDGNGCTATGSATVTEPTAVTASATATDVLCNGGATGTATAAGNGGTGAFSFLWQDGQTTATATGLIAGTYNVTVSDANGCAATTTATVGEPTALSSMVMSTTIVACNGGTDGEAEVMGMGGAGSYTYLWSDGQTAALATGLVAGSYTVTISDVNGCQVTESVTITEPSAITLTTASVDPTGCGFSDGEVSVTAAGGTVPYSFLWSDGATADVNSGVVAGTYSVTVTDDNGCEATASVTIADPAGITASATATDALCNGDANGDATATVTGGTGGADFLWSDGQTTATATGLAAGTYTVTVTETNGCTATATATVAEPTALTVTTTDSSATCETCADGEAAAVVAGGTAPYNYLWSDGQTTDVATALLTGTYTVTVTDANGCETTATVTVGFTTGTDVVAGADAIRLFPNPTKEIAYLENLPLNARVTLFDALGQEVWALETSDATLTISLRDLPAATYLVRIVSGDVLVTKSLIKRD